MITKKSEWRFQLESVLRVEEGDLQRDLHNFYHRRKKVRLGAVLGSLAGLSKTRGAHAYCIQKNIPLMKGYFHVATKLALASAKLDGGETFEVPMIFLYGLLSDSWEVVCALANVETPELLRERDNPLWPRFHIHMLQLAIQGEDEALLKKITKLAKNGKRPLREECALSKDFYSLLLRRVLIATEI